MLGVSVNVAVTELTVACDGISVVELHATYTTGQQRYVGGT